MKTLFFSRSNPKSRKFLLLGALLAAPVALQVANGPLWAQTATSGSLGQKAAQIADNAAKVAQSLNLSDAQKAQLKAIAQKYAPQIRAVVTNSSLSASQKKTQLEALRTSIKSEVDAVLTPKQRAQVALLRATLEKEISALVAQIAAQINLTDDQKANITSILQNARFEAAAIITDSSASKSEKRSELVALRTKTRGSIAALLTPAQQSRAAAIANQIRPELTKRIQAWRSSGGLGLGLVS